MAKKLKPIPKFASEAEERQFWENPEMNSLDYVDWSNAQRVSLPKLKRSTSSISLRLSDSFLDEIRSQANRLDVPYQSLMKVWLAEKLAEQNRPGR
jgi:predicted DNA binding CopG/RHH family protein